MGVRVKRASIGSAFVDGACGRLQCRSCAPPPFTVKKLECSKQAFAVNTLAWNNRIGLGSILLVCEGRVMIKRDGWGHLYSDVRGEILRSPEDKQLRKRLPRTFSLIKNESKGIEDDQIPS